MSRWALVLALFALSACGGATGPAQVTNGARASAGDREAALAAITDGCGLPRTALRTQGDMIVLQPPLDAGRDRFDCLLRQISANGLTANMQMGFIGNERAEENHVEAR